MDYSDYLTPEKLAVEEQAWLEVKLYEKYGTGIRRMIAEFNCGAQIIEYGCGIGLVPQTLDGSLIGAYTLIDGNPLCAAKARERNKDRGWAIVLEKDLRKIIPGHRTLACSFAVLKHFPLAEFNELFVRLFRFAEYALFTVAIAPVVDRSVTDDAEFTHVRICEVDLAAAIRAAGHVEVWRDVSDPEEPMIATRKMTDVELRRDDVMPGYVKRLEEWLS